MAKYSGKTATTHRAVPTAPIQTTDQRTRTYNGDEAYVRDAKSELFVLAVNFMGEQENTFYETGNDRQNRFVALIRQVTNEDAKWMQNFIPFLRNEAFMRTASVVAAAEYVKAGGPLAPTVVDSAIKRADEPAEMLGYWLAKYGRPIPQGIKRGVAKAARRLYTEFNALKYDTNSRGVRFGDVLELAHPKPTSPEQSTLFKYSLDKRHHPDNITDDLVTFDLPMIRDNIALRDIKRENRRDYLRNHPDVIQRAGMTWESLSEWLPGGMDAEAWEWMIPNMGYMALLRNLRNFDEAGVSDAVADKVIARLSDPEQVTKSMQFPFRFYSAYKNTNSTRWARALDQALDLSTANVPKLNGRSLVLIDLSRSMGAPMSTKSTMRMWEAAALFGVAQFRAAGFVGNIVGFGDTSQDIKMPKGTSILKGIDKVANTNVGHSTNLWPALKAHYDGHDRVFIFTDMQANSFYGTKPTVNGPLYFWNLGGYRPAATALGRNGVYEMGGLSDVTFRQIPLLEASRVASWPWEM